MKPTKNPRALAGADAGANSDNSKAKSGSTFIQVPHSILARKDLNASAKLLYGAIADRIGNNADCWPGQRRLATDCGTTAGTINKAAKALSEAGLIDIRPGSMSGPRAKRTSRYRIRPTGKTNVDNLDTSKDGQRAPIHNVNEVEYQTPTLLNLTQNQTHKPNPETQTPSRRSPDPIWDAVCEAFALNPVTAGERRRVGRIVRDLNKKGAKPDDIFTRLERYRREWPKISDTPEALLKHWDRFAAERATGGSVSRIRAPEHEYARVVEALAPNASECSTTTHPAPRES